MANDGPPDGYVTSAEACARLNISDRTLRRRVAAGTIEGEYLPRPQGSVLYVKLPGEAAMQTAPVVDEAAPGGMGSGTPPEDAAEAAAPPTEPPVLTTRTLDILDALLHANSDTMERQAERIAALERENGGLSTAVGAYRREVEWLQAELERSRRPWWRKLLDG